jgi:predicted ester cyclase
MRRVAAVACEGDPVAARVIPEGTNLGPLSGIIPPTGKQFSARQSHWYRASIGPRVTI